MLVFLMSIEHNINLGNFKSQITLLNKTENTTYRNESNNMEEFLTLLTGILVADASLLSRPPKVALGGSALLDR